MAEHTGTESSDGSDPQEWRTWFGSNTHTAARWPVEVVLDAKRRSGCSVAVVLPARNEQDTVGTIVSRIQYELVAPGVVDELVVMDSFSTDATAERARDAGATVVAVDQVRPALPAVAGKGEALWRSQFVTRSDLLVFLDADVSDFSSAFVTGLLGPLVSDRRIDLVKGFYERVSADDRPGGATQGGRVTELMARPLIASRWPQVSAVVQPLSGEWAIRRTLLETLSLPVGYGVELAVLIDTFAGRGLDAIAQVDLGRRTHRHQEIRRLGVMSAELLAVADQRAPLARSSAGGGLVQFENGRLRERAVPVTVRPPAASMVHQPGGVR